MSQLPRPIRVMIVDDHPMMRDGINAVLSYSQDIEVVTIAVDGFDAIKKFQLHCPEVTLVDLQMPGMDGISVIASIRRIDPNARMIVLSSLHGDARVSAALRAGALSYIMKDALGTELVSSIKNTYLGQEVVATELKQQLAEFSIYDAVSLRELDVLRLAAEGMSNREIGEKLNIRETTVKSHVSTILTKLGASDRTHAVIIALRRGYIKI